MRFLFPTERDFIEHARARLCSSQDGVQPFRGGWVGALEKGLHAYDLLKGRPPYTQGDVVDCFCNAPKEAVEVLFMVLSDACREHPPSNEESLFWATELTCLAAARALKFETWAGFESVCDDPKNKFAYSAKVEASSHLMVAVAFSRLMGLRLVWGQQNVPDSMLDLTDCTSRSSDIKAAWITGIANQLDRMEGKPEHPDPNRVLSPEEIGALRTRFARQRIKRAFSGVYVRVPEHLMHDQVMDQLSEVAKVLNITAVGGSREDGAGLVCEEETQMTSASLLANIKEVFDSFVRSSSKGASVDTLAPGSYKYDVFLSHASEDKETLVRDLRLALSSARISVWFDAEEMGAGDRLSSSIQEGIRTSRYGLAVITEAYIQKKNRWSGGELGAFLNAEYSSEKTRLLWVRFGVTQERVAEVFPMLADKIGIDGGDGRSLPPEVVEKIAEKIRSSTT